MQNQKSTLAHRSSHATALRPQLSNILYVEDSILVQKIARIALRDIGGFRVEFCTNGVEALVTAAHSMPDLLLLDRNLPDMSGMELLKRLRRDAALKNVPVIFITATTDTQDLEELRKLSQMPVIRKPFNPKFLAGEIERCWQSAVV